jgi:hypothetical protein
MSVTIMTKGLHDELFFVGNNDRTVTYLTDLLLQYTV